MKAVDAEIFNKHITEEIENILKNIIYIIVKG